MHYSQWPGKTWTVRSSSTPDLGIGDELKFVLVPASPADKIKINALTCTDNPGHTGDEWMGRECEGVGALDTVEGTTASKKGLRIVSEPISGSRTRLTCTVFNLPKPGETEGPVVVGGGVCWTAEDG